MPRKICGPYKALSQLKSTYRQIRRNDVNKGKAVYEHRWLMEQLLGRSLTRHEHVHHKNGDTKDNRLDNLELMSASEHSREHILPFAAQRSKLGHAARWGVHYS